MYKYNIYKLEASKYDELMKKCELVGLKKIAGKEVDGYDLIFMLSTAPDSVNIWWMSLLDDFDVSIEPLKNQIYFGILLIKSANSLYAISFGKSHFYLQRFADLDFGLELAERIMDSADTRMKNTKFFKSRRSKSITSYVRGTQISIDSGESFHFVRAKTIDSVKWGAVASFGTSVQLILSAKPTELPNIVNQIESTLNEPRIFNLPKVEKIKDGESKKTLDQLLGKTLSTLPPSTVSVDEVALSGVDFIFSSSCRYSLFVKGEFQDRYPIDELSVENLRKFSKTQGVNLEKSLNQIMVHVESDFSKPRSERLKTFLDYVDEERNCLIDGEWYRFNNSYLTYLADEVDRITYEYDDTLDLTSKIKEEDFNSAQAQYGYKNLDRSLIRLDGRYSVEMTDLYKNNALYFVKIGKTKELVYVFDQAESAVKLLRNNAVEFKVDGKKVKVKTICVWIFLERQSEIQKLSELNSLIFQMKALDWSRTVRDAGYDPQIRVNYLRTIPTT